MTYFLDFCMLLNLLSIDLIVLSEVKYIIKVLLFCFSPQTIIELVEKNSFDLTKFCSTCLVSIAGRLTFFDNICTF